MKKECQSQMQTSLGNKRSLFERIVAVLDEVAEYPNDPYYGYEIMKTLLEELLKDVPHPDQLSLGL